MITQRLQGVLMAILRAQRRFDPFLRPAFDATLRDPIANLLQWAINLGRKNDGLALAQEKPEPDEGAFLDSMIASIQTFLHAFWKPGGYERGGNTKTHGMVRAEFVVRDDLAPHLKRGLFAQAKAYRAWVRFSGPGPDWPKDIDDVGFVSMSIKVMGVPGPKLLDDEKFTQDFTGVCTPTFVTPDTKCNAQLQQRIVSGTTFFYFFNLRTPHVLDALMQSLWNKTQNNPLQARYYSTVPYLLGEGQAMLYSMRPRSNKQDRVPNVPFRPPDNYLRDAMVRTLANEDVEFDFLVQVQTDAHRMPIENAAVRWPEHLSPFVPVATVRIPKQVFDSPEQIAFARYLKYNPWHCLPEHRPLGNQSRARLRMYSAASDLRQKMNATPHLEPTGDESFP
ncbi:MAG: catalase family protein [Candidatus Elarobacter sp.]